MRTRRRFQPTIEFMPLRMVPSAVGCPLNPMDPTTDPSAPSPPAVNPMDPTTDPSDPTSSPSVAPGSFLPLTPDPTMLC